MADKRARGRSRRHRAIVGVLTAALVLTACWGDDDDETTPTSATTDVGDSRPAEPAEPIVTVEGVALGETTPSLGLRLSDGEAADTVTEPVRLVEGTPLGDAEIEALLARLPDWTVPPTDQVTFNRPAETLLPPTVGETVDETFPPAVDAGDPADAPPSGPLEVLRYQPEGPVDLAPFIAVTFSEPMVPLGTLDDLDDADVPVVVTPAVEGRWRWIGTRTLRFELVPGELDRLPAATEYLVEVPAGTRSANGARLAETVSWTFTTPTPTLTDLAGIGESMTTEPVWVATFDQRVEPSAVIGAITVEAGGTPVSIREATASEVDDDDVARRAADAALEGRAVAFTPVTPLPVDTAIVVRVGPDVPSAEGPLVARGLERFDGRTFGALRIVDHRCSWGDDCAPGSSFVIELSNRLDPERFEASLVDVSPAIPGLRIDVYGSVIELSGAVRGRTTYEVTLDGDLADVFGQSLSGDQTVSFDVGPARPALVGLQRSFITTDPTAERPSVSITTINHDAVQVRAWAVTPDRIGEFREYVDAVRSDADAEPPEWQIVFDEEVEIDGDADTFVETTVDLSRAFNSAGSQVVVRVDSLLDLTENDDDYWQNRPTIAWVQSTTLGVDAILDNDELVISTTDLTTGEPVAGVPVELLGDGRVATTDEEGLAEVSLGSDGILGLWANAGDRAALLPADEWDGWITTSSSDDSRWYVFDDRGVYRPGETVRLKGWVRRLAWDDDARLELFGDDVRLTYQAWDTQGVELASGDVPLGALGGFGLEIDLPAGANLGPAWIEFRLEGTAEFQGFSHSFQIQEFRRPEFEVTARAESPGPYLVAEPATVAVDAEYFAGGPLPDADVTWLVSSRDTTYAPPGWDDYEFGVWQPWWWSGEAVRGGPLEGAAVDIATDVAAEGDICIDCGPIDDTRYEQFDGRTDASGTHFLRIDIDRNGVDLPSSVTAEATVFDIDRQAWADRVDLVVHPADVYVGVRSDRNFVRQGTPIRVDLVVTDIDGAAVAGRPVEVVAGRVEGRFDGSEWVEEVVDPATCELTSTDDPTDESMRCEFDTEVGGQYRITAIVTDAAGDTNRSEITQWVSGGETRPTRNVEQETVTIVPDQEEYLPGETAELLVQAPFEPAHGVMTVIRHGIVSSEAFEAEDGTAVLEIPVDDALVPNVTVQIDMTGSAVRVDDDGIERPDLPPRPAFATGQIDLPIPPLTRELAVTAAPAVAALEPGDDTNVTVSVVNAAGDPVADAEVAVVVVDEAILSLTDHELTDPLDVFYRDVWSVVRSQYLRSSLLLAAADEFGTDESLTSRSLEAPAADIAADADAEEAADDAGGDGAGNGAAPSIDLRSDFDALALFAPDETTGEDGTVSVDVSLPDTLTRYRVMAVAVDGAERFGKGESTITARLPLMVRAAAPRFLNYGDRFELPVVVQNQSDDPIEVDVAVQVANVEVLGDEGRRVTVPANDRVEVRFPATTQSAGTARIRVVAAGGAFADASEFDLPVYTPSTREAFATYGVVDEGAVAQPVLPPADVIDEFGGLEIGTSSTALQALTDAVLYLEDYEFESSDAYASRVMAVAALRDVLDAFDAEGLPPPDELRARVSDDISDLVALQNDDGGFPYWQRRRQSVPWNSIQAAHALVIARDAGYSVPPEALTLALGYVDEIERHIPSEYSEQTRRSLRAYAFQVLDLAGQRDVLGATELYREAEGELEPDALAWIWSSILDEEVRIEIERAITNAAVETAGAASIATGYTEDAFVIAQSDRRTDGIVLDALIGQTPESDLIPKLVAGLLGQQRRGHWSNVQENAFILLALHRYFEAFEANDPAFVARAWLGETYVAETEFLERTTLQANTTIPMANLLELTAADGDDATPLVLAKDGEGRLYYRLGVTYAPADLRLDARDEGFVVERAYEAVDGADVRLDAEGNWHIPTGSTVRVRVTMVADAPRAHVALTDPLPAGLEPINPAFTASQTIPPGNADDDTPDEPLWWWRWFEHQNLRDDRAEAFATYLYGGTYEYTYLARATTPGTYVVPPATGEEIYSPEVFGRTATDLVIVE